MGKIERKTDDLDLPQIKNPEAMGESEKKIWKRCEPILNELLEELKANGKIEISYTQSEADHLNGIIENLNLIGTNNNLLINQGESIEKAGKFVKALSEFGFNDSTSAHLYVEVAAFLSIQDFECFKTALLFHLKDVDFQVFNFAKTMQEFAPRTWKKLRPLLDNKLRNSVAHGLWGIENKQIVLFEDAKLTPFAKLSLSQFIIRVKTQNLLFSCLMNLIHKKMKDGFFAC
jgi:hypothetical protein